MIVWAVVSIGRLPPMDGPPPSREGVGLLTVLAVIAVGLYALAAWRAIQLYRLRGGNVLLSLSVAMILLAEAMIAVVVSRNWRLSWWEWHVLMLAAFVAIALGARSEYRRSGTLTGAFGGLYLEATLARLDRWHAGAIAAVAAAEEGGGSSEQVMAGLRREGATDTDIVLLEEAARELRRLDDAFRPYLPTVLAEGIRQGAPAIDQLGGEERVVSVLFADLAGFTTFSETRAPTEVLAMLNEQWAAVDARRESMETAFWALMREVFPAQTRTHMRAAGREQLLAARSYLDHWITKLDEKAPAAAPPEREEIAVE